MADSVVPYQIAYELFTLAFSVMPANTQISLHMCCAGCADFKPYRLICVLGVWWHNACLDVAPIS